MITPARRRAIEIAARKAGNGTLTPASPGASEYRLLQMALGADLRALSNIQSVERKIEAKRIAIVRYEPWITGVLAGAKADKAAGAQDDIVVTMLVWAIDIARWPLALDLTAHVLTHGIALPERYRRTPATLIAEEVAEAGLLPAPTVDLKTLLAVDQLTAKRDMPDEVRAKLNKALGAAFRAAADAFDPEADSATAGGRPALLNNALRHYTRALGLDAKCGVKGQVNQLQKQLAALPKANAAATEDDDA